MQRSRSKKCKGTVPIEVYVPSMKKIVFGNKGVMTNVSVSGKNILKVMQRSRPKKSVHQGKDLT